jgi:hypothetical protein
MGYSLGGRNLRNLNGGLYRILTLVTSHQRGDYPATSGTGFPLTAITRWATTKNESLAKRLTVIPAVLKRESREAIWIPALAGRTSGLS